MSEPRDPFDSFDTEGLAVTSLPPSEVRRRGERLRRRRHASGVVAGVAAVALIATPIALIAGGDDSASPSPTPPGGTWVTTIPEDFPLLAGVENDPEGSDPTISADLLSEPLTLCEDEVWPAESVDRLAGADPALDYSYSRELLLFPSDADAQAALARVRNRLADCASEVTTDGAIPDTEFELVHSAYDEDTGADDSVTWTDAYADGSIGTQVFQFVLVGNAVARTVVSSESDKDGVAGQLPMVTRASSTLVDAMCIFAADPCERPTETQAAEPVAGADIPETFPLASGFPEDSEVENPVKGPRTDLASLEYQACGSAVPDAAREDRLFASYTNAEDFRDRWLTTYPDAETAQTALDAMVDSWRGCPVEPERSDGYVTNREMRELPSGDEAWAILERDTFEGGETAFGATIVLVRIGNAIFLEDRSGHGGYPSGDGSRGIDDLLSSAAEVLDAMCTFAEDRCGSVEDAPLISADLIDPEETQPRYESAWETRATYDSEGEDAINPCFTETVTERGATAVFRRDFDLFGPQGKSDGDWMTAVVAEFGDAEGAAAAYDSFAQDMGLCAGRIGTRFDGFEDRPPTTVGLENVEGEARAYYATYDIEGVPEAVNRMETGIALVGTRIVLLTTVAGPFERVEPPSPTAMEVMLVQAAERLTPGPAGPITPIIQMV